MEMLINLPDRSVDVTLKSPFLFNLFRSLQNEISAKQSISEELTKAKAQHLEAEKTLAARSKDVDDLHRQLEESRVENRKLIAR